MIPNFLIDRLNKQYGNNLTLDIIKSYNVIRKTAIRINTIKSNLTEVEETLSKNNIKYNKVGWSNFSLVLESNMEDEIKELDIYKEGKVYLQSLSSQLPPLFLNPEENENILDMTAAPGGKTTEIAALSNNNALITATEKNKKRFERLKYNIDHLGVKKTTVLNVDARNLDEYFMFDKILLDAPCSGSGTLNIKSLENFNEDLINRSVNFQTSLIKEAIKHLKVGGELIYSTCSILKEENENIITKLLEENKNLELVPLNLDIYKDIPTLPVTLEGTLCVMPSELYEGFFVSIIKKNN